LVKVFFYDFADILKDGENLVLEHEKQPEKTNSKSQSITRLKDIEGMLKSITGNDDEFEEFFESVHEAKNRKKVKYLQLSSQVNILERNKSRCFTAETNQVRIRSRPISQNEKWRRVAELRDHIEDNMAMRKFLMSHRWVIIRKHVFSSFSKVKKG